MVAKRGNPLKQLNLLFFFAIMFGTYFLLKCSMFGKRIHSCPFKSRTNLEIIVRSLTPNGRPTRSCGELSYLNLKVSFSITLNDMYFELMQFISLFQHHFVTMLFVPS